MTQWSIAPVIDWLLHKGRHLPRPDALVGELCARVRAAGMPIDRVAFFFGTLHPQYFGMAMHWDGASVRILKASYQMGETEEVRSSPARRITEGERVIRRRLEQADCPMDFPILQELREAGITDYVIAEVLFGNGGRNSVSLATRRQGGFTDHDIAEVQRLLHPFGMAMEIHVGRALSQTLLDTYLGRISGTRVLDGQIKRGDGQSIDAVIWFSDLRESTPLSESLGERRFLELLNDYFLATAGAVLEHGGEVLRFIGDASLAVFPTGSEPPAIAGAGRQCRPPERAARRIFLRSRPAPGARVLRQYRHAGAARILRHRHGCEQGGAHRGPVQGNRAGRGAVERVRDGAGHALPQTRQVRLAGRSGRRGSVRPALTSICSFPPPCGATGRWSWQGGRRGCVPARWRHPGCCGSH